MREERPRLDALLVEKGLAESRQKAQALILSGAVRVGSEVVTKAGSRFSPSDELTVEEKSASYVSRAGEKLAFALDEFGVGAEGRLCVDAGASTGGFTDVLLRRGAHKVLAVDVGYGQLDWSLRTDPRVEVMERTNVRRLSGEDLAFAPELLVADLSFISLPVALSRLLRTTPSIREAVVLVKPQFEAGPEHVGRGGLVRDPEVRARAIFDVALAFSGLGFGAAALARSPVAGRKSGNREYPLHLVRAERSVLDTDRVREVVRG